MIRTLIRWSLILVVVGTTFFSWGVIDNSIAIALTEAEVLHILEPVPVFIILDQKGNPLVVEMTKNARVDGAFTDNTEEVFVAGAFISPTDAKQFVNRLQTDNSELAEQVTVVPVSLAELYQQEKSFREQKNLSFNFIPNEEILAYAKTLLPEENRQRFQEVPLFAAKDAKSRQYLIVSINSEQIVPFFFDNRQLEQMISKYQETNPEKNATFDIQVVSLAGVIRTLETETDSDEMLSISLVPLTESQQFIQNLRQQ